MNQKDHYDFTVNEWSSHPFIDLLESIDKEKVEVLYDIGACVGGFTDVFKRRFPLKKAYLFEPDKENADYIKEEPLKELIRQGIYYGERQAKVFNTSSNVGSYSIVRDLNDTGKVFNLVTLEELNLLRPDVIKLDVEGAEKNIIEHSEVVKHCPYLIVEWHFDEDARKFFEQHLKHKVAFSILEKMFLLKL